MVKNFIKKTFGGLKKEYLIRQYLFGAIFLLLFFSMAIFKFKFPESIYLMVYASILWLFYPYARFVYESIVNYIIGDNVIYKNAIWYLTIKVIFMALCFGFSIFIAPLGLIYLYFHMSKLEKQASIDNIEN